MIEVRLQGIGKRYRAGGVDVDAIRDLDLEIAAGESVAVMGPSGCGKSTLLGLIAGLEPPTRGTIGVGGLDIGALDDRARTRYRRDTLGIVFQSADLLAFLTAAENVDLALALRGRSDPAAARALLDGLGLAAHADKLPDQLSGGQRERVGIARALAARPKLILADEPTGELDTAASASVMRLLQQSHRDLGATLVVVTHDPRAAARLDRIVRLRDGQIIHDSRASAPLTADALV